MSKGKTLSEQLLQTAKHTAMRVKYTGHLRTRGSSLLQHWVLLPCKRKSPCCSRWTYARSPTYTRASILSRLVEKLRCLWTANKWGCRGHFHLVIQGLDIQGLGNSTSRYTQREAPSPQPIKPKEAGRLAQVSEMRCLCHKPYFQVSPVAVGAGTSSQATKDSSELPAV